MQFGGVCRDLGESVMICTWGSSFSLCEGGLECLLWHLCSEQRLLLS